MIDSKTKIIIQRFFPSEQYIKEKICNNKIFLWIHDVMEPSVFLGNDQSLSRYYKNDANADEYKNKVLSWILDMKNLNFVFNSNHCKKLFVDHLSKFSVEIENERLNVIYNILYEDEFKNVNNMNNMVTECNKNNIVYASAWQKGIEKVISIFEYVISQNKDFKLILMSPGYDFNKFKDYAKELQDKFKDNITILGPLSKDKYCEVIKSSLCVLSSTFNETFGCVFAESYYLGTPVIADVRSGAIKEIIDNDCIVNYDYPEQVFTKIMDIQKNRDRLNIKLDKKFMLDYNLSLWNEKI